jgi:hypothetical protein
MPAPRLIFFPTDSAQAIDSKLTTQALIDAECIIAQAFPDNHYLPGERFLNLLTFLGCSPNINLQPTEGESHCFISILEASSETRYLGSTQSVNPKCPNCKKRIADWKTNHWQKADELCLCDKCQIKTGYSKLNWKLECGFGRCGFEIHHIYPHEAVPTDLLLTILQTFSGFEWNYAYVNN